MAKDEGEGPDDWTELMQTRISPRARKLLDEQMKKNMSPSYAVAVRKLIYQGLGLIDKDA